MHFTATQLLTVALAGFAAAAPSRSTKRNRETVIGYRTVNKVPHFNAFGFQFMM